MRIRTLLGRALLVLLPFSCIPATARAAEEVQLLLTTESGAVTSGRRVDIFGNDNVQDNIIQPGSMGTFHFTISNPEDFDVDFRLAITEENLHNVPIEFSLQTNGKTVLEDGDEWLSATELAGHEECLAAGAAREMALHWRWLYTLDEQRDAFDTGLGGHEQATATGAYSLLLDVYAEQRDSAGNPAAPGKDIAGTNNRQAYKPKAAYSTAPSVRANAAQTAAAKQATKNAATATRPVQTGDTQNHTMFFALLFGGFVALLLLAALKKRFVNPPENERHPPW